jgi:hypothetical protein
LQFAVQIDLFRTNKIFDFSHLFPFPGALFCLCPQALPVARPPALVSAPSLVLAIILLFSKRGGSLRFLTAGWTPPAEFLSIFPFFTNDVFIHNDRLRCQCVNYCEASNFFRACDWNLRASLSATPASTR